ncbi:MAG: urease accessory protein UreD [Gordonia sp. (in: high G+C Gram-positive bacteria)]
MRTEVEIIAEAGRSVRFAATGAIVVRQTGRTAAHLVGNATTPLGGDDIDIVVRVGAGAALDLGSVAAMIALPGREVTGSTARWHIDVGAGGRLRVDAQPTVVAGGADHHSEVTVDLHPDATLDLHEYAQIGRYAPGFPDDDRGRWSGALRVDTADPAVPAGARPLLRHRVALGPGSTVHPLGLRALATVFRYPDARAGAVDPQRYAARLALAGDATLTTALAPTVTQAGAFCDALDVATLAAQTS